MMAPEYPTPTMLALDAIEERTAGLIVQMNDKRDAAKIHRRWAAEKDAEADVARARINRMALVRSRVLRSAS